MGKLDDMRRHREAAYAKRDAARPAPAEAASVAEEAIPEDCAAPAPEAGRRGGMAHRGDEVTEGVCTGCGKVRAVQNGVIAAHQKGLGKVCVGSRKAPA